MVNDVSTQAATDTAELATHQRISTPKLTEIH